MRFGLIRSSLVLISIIPLDLTRTRFQGLRIDGWVNPGGVIHEITVMKEVYVDVIRSILVVQPPHTSRLPFHCPVRICIVLLLLRVVLLRMIVLS